MGLAISNSLNVGWFLLIEDLGFDLVCAENRGGHGKLLHFGGQNFELHEQKPAGKTT